MEGRDGQYRTKSAKSAKSALGSEMKVSRKLDVWG